jgi:uncharacterized protein YukE
MSTHTAQAMLHHAKREFEEAYKKVRQQWNDQAAEQFHQDYIEPLEGRIQQASTAMQELGDILERVRREMQRPGD